ncbi:hypothetical protein MSPP1_003831 [Malassezia sp. CBS 17886]|nr:hypothetical protein MSPP1_003831 [Malassezia sp. CBS 17886]
MLTRPRVAVLVFANNPGQPAVPVLSAWDLSSFSWMQRGTVQDMMAFMAKTVAERTAPTQRQSIQENSFTAHVHARPAVDGITGVLISDSEYPVRVAYSLLNKLLEEFLVNVPKTAWKTQSSTIAASGNVPAKGDGIVSASQFPTAQEYLKRYQDPRQADTILRVQQELDDTKIVLHNTIDSVLQRGEDLDKLVEKSGSLSQQSKMFYKSARKDPLRAPRLPRVRDVLAHARAAPVPYRVHSKTRAAALCNRRRAQGASASGTYASGTYAPAWPPPAIRAPVAPRASLAIRMGTHGPPGRASQMEPHALDPLRQDADALFAAMSVRQVEAYAATVAERARAKQQATRTLVGNSFEDLLAVAKAVLGMQMHMDALHGVLNTLDGAAADAASPSGAHRADARAAAPDAAFSAPEVAAGALLLRDAPALVRRALHSNELLFAAWALRYATATWRWFQRMPEAAREAAQFVAMSGQWAVLQQERAAVVHASCSVLRRATAETHNVLAALAAVSLLQGANGGAAGAQRSGRGGAASDESTGVAGSHPQTHGPPDYSDMLPADSDSAASPLPPPMALFLRERAAYLREILAANTTPALPVEAHLIQAPILCYAATLQQAYTLFAGNARFSQFMHALGERCGEADDETRFFSMGRAYVQQLSDAGGGGQGARSSPPPVILASAARLLDALPAAVRGAAVAPPPRVAAADVVAACCSWAASARGTLDVLGAVLEGEAMGTVHACRDALARCARTAQAIVRNAGASAEESAALQGEMDTAQTLLSRLLSARVSALLHRTLAGATDAFSAAVDGALARLDAAEDDAGALVSARWLTADDDALLSLFTCAAGVPQWPAEYARDGRVPRGGCSEGGHSPTDASRSARCADADGMFVHAIGGTRAVNECVARLVAQLCNAAAGMAAPAASRAAEPLQDACSAVAASVQQTARRVSSLRGLAFLARLCARLYTNDALRSSLAPDASFFSAVVDVYAEVVERWSRLCVADVVGGGGGRGSESACVGRDGVGGDGGAQQRERRTFDPRGTADGDTYGATDGATAGSEPGTLSAANAAGARASDAAEHPDCPTHALVSSLRRLARAQHTAGVALIGGVAPQEGIAPLCEAPLLPHFVEAWANHASAAPLRDGTQQLFDAAFCGQLLNGCRAETEPAQNALSRMRAAAVSGTQPGAGAAESAVARVRIALAPWAAAPHAEGSTGSRTASTRGTGVALATPVPRFTWAGDGAATAL